MERDFYTTVLESHRQDVQDQRRILVWWAFICGAFLVISALSIVFTTVWGVSWASCGIVVGFAVSASVSTWIGDEWKRYKEARAELLLWEVLAS